MITSEPLLCLRGHRDMVRSLAFSPNDAILASLSILNDQRIILWDTTTWTPIQQFRGGPGTISLQFSPDGATLVGVGVESEVRLWDVSSGAMQAIPAHDRNGLVRFGPAGQAYLVLHQAQGLAFYDVTAQQLVRFAPIPSTSLTIVAEDSWLNRSYYGWLNDAATLIAVVYPDYAIEVWDLAEQCTRAMLRGHTESIREIVFHPAAPLLFSASASGAIKGWDLRQATPIIAFQSNATDVWGMLLNPRLPQLAIVNGEHFIELRHSETGEVQAILAGHDSQINVAFSHDGALLASGSDDYLIRLWAV